MTDATATGSEPDWASIFAVTLGISAFGMSLGLTYPLISLILVSQGFGEKIVGLNAGIFSLGLAASTLMMPWMTARIPAGGLVVSGLGISAVTIAGFALLPGIVAWFVLRFILGFGTNLVFVLGEAWLNTACTEQIRGRVAAAFTAAMTTGFALGPLGVPLFGKEDGFGFAAGAAFVALAAVGFAILSRRARVRPEAAAPGSLRTFARAAPLIILMISAFAFVDAAAIALLPVYFLGKGFGEGLAATTVAVMFLGVLGTMPVIGLALDRFNRARVATCCALLAAAAAATIPLAASAGFYIWPVLFVFGGAFSGIYTCALTALGEGFKGGLLVAGSAVLALAYAVGGIAGPPVGGAAMEWINPEAVPVLFVLVLVSLAVVLSFRRGNA